jgi:hypothetical protein
MTISTTKPSTKLSIPHDVVKKVSGAPKGLDDTLVLETIDCAPFGRSAPKTDLGPYPRTRENDALDHIEAESALARLGQRFYDAEYGYIKYLGDLSKDFGPGLEVHPSNGAFLAAYPEPPPAQDVVKRVDTVSISKIENAQLKAVAMRVDETRPGVDQSPLGYVTFAELKQASTDDLMCIHGSALRQIVEKYMYEETTYGKALSTVELYANAQTGVRVEVDRLTARRSLTNKKMTGTDALRIEVPPGCNVLLSPLSTSGPAVALSSKDGVIELNRRELKEKLPAYDICHCAFIVVRPSDGGPGSQPEVVDRAALILDIRHLGDIVNDAPVRKSLSLDRP